METKHIQLTRITGDSSFMQDDMVAVEAQYHVRINGREAFSFTCTPSNVEEMVIGALYSRGYIDSAPQIRAVEISDSEVTVSLNTHSTPSEPNRAGKIHLDEETIFRTVKTIFSDPDTLFNRTGCAHSCALMHNGEILCIFEDIGRHNALDKVIGCALKRGIPMNECVIFTSGRISGDYMAKIIHAGMPIAVSRAAVTSEAVRLAKQHGVTLYGFVRGNSANLYHG